MSNHELSDEEVETIHEDQACCNNPEAPLADEVESESVSVRIKHFVKHEYCLATLPI